MDIKALLERLIVDDRLDLSELGLTDDDLAQVALVPGVTDLRLGQNPLITIEGIKKLAPLGSCITKLDLWDVPINDEVLRILTTLFPNLQQLWFGGDGVTVTIDGLKILAGFSHLVNVMVQDDEVHEELCRLYPSLEVEI